MTIQGKTIILDKGEEETVPITEIRHRSDRHRRLCQKTESKDGI